MDKPEQGQQIKISTVHRLASKTVLESIHKRRQNKDINSGIQCRMLCASISSELNMESLNIEHLTIIMPRIFPVSWRRPAVQMGWSRFSATHGSIKSVVFVNRDAFFESHR